MTEAVFLFPGQGSQFVGMGEGLHRTFPDARAAFAEAGEALGFDLARLCFHGPEDELVKTHNTQPAVLVHAVAAWRVLAARGLTPRAAAGHSLGEYSAYVAAGSLTVTDAVRLVRRRGELMYAAGRERPGAMAAILGLDGDTVDALCARVTGGIVVAANLNSPGQVAISGDPAAVEGAMALAREAGAKRAVPLPVSGAFHSPLMERAAAGLREALASVRIAPAAIPVIANASAEPVTGPEAIRESLARQLQSPVRWEAGMRALLRDPGPPFVEAGPGKVLKGLLKAIDRDARCESVGDADDVARVLAA
jgi:[acyl-carrier-protein] S-malonyltransferase